MTLKVSRCPDAATMVYVAIKRPAGDQVRQQMSPKVIGQASSDGSGQFRVDAPRTSSARHQTVGIVALAPGYGAGWTTFDIDADQPIADVSLRPEQVIRGRLFDLKGQPVQGVTVWVAATRRVLVRSPNLLSERLEGPLFYSWADGIDLPAWPRPATSDAEGRFTIRGAGRGLRADLRVNDLRFARQTIQVETDGTAESKVVTQALEPAKLITGRITAADTGKPIPRAQVLILAYTRGVYMFNDFEADAEGRFRANPLSADSYSVRATASDGQPYLNTSKSFAWPKGAVEYPVDLALPRGALIRGKVTEEGSGKPVAGSRINFHAFRQSTGNQGDLLVEYTATGSDGSFQFGVQPSTGYLTVLGPNDDYAFREIGDNMVGEGKPGGVRDYFHAFLACELKSASQTLDVNVVLRPGMTVRGKVLGLDNQPVQDAWMISRVFLPATATSLLRWSATHHGEVKSGQFEVHGLDPDAEAPVYFLDPHQKLGATVNLSGKSTADGSVTVRLQPCGTAKARLIDATGEPIAGYRGSNLVSMVVTPGPSFSRQPQNETRLFADRAALARVDSINYKDGPISDAQGQVSFPALVPGATYRRFDPRRGRTPTRERLHRQAWRDARPGRYRDRETSKVSGRHPMNDRKVLALLAERHRGGSHTRSHGPRGNAVFHALRR